MFVRTRLAVLTGTALLATVGLATFGVATASAMVVPTCNGLAATIVVPVSGVVTNGGGGNDVIVGTNGPDWINGGGGNDTICGLDGLDTLNGGEGNDRIFGQRGDDRLFGGPGVDLLDGGPHFGGDSGNSGPGADVCVNVEFPPVAC